MAAAYARLKEIAGDWLDADSPSGVATYTTPERGLAGTTPLVLRPRTPAQVQALIAACHEAGQPLVIAAGRTGLVEAQKPQGEVVLSLERLDSFIGIEQTESGPVATAQAGIPIDTLNEYLWHEGLVFPMEMGSSATATLGGCVANGSAGANAVCYGTAADLAVQVTGVDGHGAWRTDERPAKADTANGLVINSARFPYGDSLIGSQGALGVITQATVRVFPLPKQREGALIAFDRLADALALLAEARKTFPGDVEEFEFLSGETLALAMETKAHSPFYSSQAPHRAPWHVLLQLKAQEEGDLQELLVEFLMEHGPDEERISLAPLKRLKEMRHSLTETSNLRVGALRKDPSDQIEEFRVAFDVAAPLDRFEAFIDSIRQAVAKVTGIYLLVEFGHLGVGGAHIHVLRTDGAKLGVKKAAIVAGVLEACRSHGGTFSAEHGIGSKWSEAFVSDAPVATVFQVQAAIKAADPKGILNPRAFGKAALLAR